MTTALFAKYSTTFQSCIDRVSLAATIILNFGNIELTPSEIEAVGEQLRDAARGLQDVCNKLDVGAE